MGGTGRALAVCGAQEAEAGGAFGRWKQLSCELLDDFLELRTLIGLRFCFGATTTYSHCVLLALRPVYGIPYQSLARNDF